MRVHGAKYVLALAAGAGLAFAGGSQAAGHRQIGCAPGHVRRSVRVPERRHGRIVHRHGRIVYVRVQRCVKVKGRPKPEPTPTSPATTTTAVAAAPPPLPLPTVTTTTTATTPADTTTTTSTTATATTSTTTTTTPPPPPPAYSGTCATPVPGDSQTVGGNSYALEGMDTFTTDAPLGSFAQTSIGYSDANALPVVYTGDHGMGWTEYPDGWASTYTQPPYSPTVYEGYEPSTVQSVHDGVLDFALHDDANGYPVGADPSPLPGGNRYQIYGAWSFCERIVPADSSNLADFHQAPLLWPENRNDYPSAESDFPEADLDAAPSPAGPWWSAYAHYATTGGQDTQDAYAIAAAVPDFDPTQWHAYTQTWGPGFRSYYVDGQLVGTSTDQVWQGPERWQLQVEPSVAGGSGTGHVYVKWVWIGTAP